MEPISLIVGALVAGAAASAGDVGGQAVKDAYAALKALIVNRFKRGSKVAALEEDPSQSSAQKKDLEESLGRTDAAKDPEALALACEKAHELTKALIESVPREALVGVGVQYDDLHALYAHLKEVNAPGGPGIGVYIKKASFQEGFIIDRVGGGRDPKS